MRRLPKIGGLVVLIVSLLIPLPVASQTGRGAIVMVNPDGAANLELNPLRCPTATCALVNGLLYPWLIGVDPATGQLAPTDDALARSWEVAPDGSSITFKLRDDLAWSDGAPITVHDVVYSYLAIASGKLGASYARQVNATITGGYLSDRYTITFRYDPASCAALDYTRFPIIPAHYFESTYGDRLPEDFSMTESPYVEFARGQAQQLADYFGGLPNLAPERAALPTAGIFALDRVQPLDYVRLVRANDPLGLELIDLSPGRDMTDMFLAGETNVIINPPFNRRADIRAVPGVQVYTSPGPLWESINFNLAETRNPQSAFDDEGNPLEQGVHPIFGDVRVRRAIQQAIDVPALIEAALEGYGTVLPASLLPTSWAYNADLAPVPYDPMAAARLLEEAGWKAVYRSGPRICTACAYAGSESSLAFELLYVQHPVNEIVVDLIVQQLALVGIQARPQGVTDSELWGRVTRQRYDAYLVLREEEYPNNPDQFDLFATENDIVGAQGNTGSYSNPRVDELLAQARSLPDCDYAARAALYHEVQAYLQAEQPYVWLFAIDSMIAAQGGIKGFDPYPDAPFWNIETWVVTR